MSTSATDTLLDNLKGVSKGKEKCKVKTTGTLEKLLDAHQTYGFDTWLLYTENRRKDIAKETKKLNQYFEKKEIVYSEQDIVDLVYYANVQDYTKDESRKMGAYVGSLITCLTKKNENLDKKTVIEIPENHLDYLGLGCEKFDVIKIEVNHGNGVFKSAREGNLLYVDLCEGESFAQWAGNHEGKVDHIIANTVNGNRFAWYAGRTEGKVDHIIANTVKGDKFALKAGSRKGKVDCIIANEVNGDNFAEEAGVEEGKVDYIIANQVNGKEFAKWAKGKVLKNSQQATEIYNQKMAEVKEVLEEYSIDWSDEL